MCHCPPASCAVCSFFAAATTNVLCPLHSTDLLAPSRFSLLILPAFVRCCHHQLAQYETDLLAPSFCPQSFAAATTNVLKASRGHWAEAFAALDIDGDGLISEADLAEVRVHSWLLQVY